MTVLVGKEPDEGAQVEVVSDAQELQTLIPTVAHAVVSRSVAEEVKRRADVGGTLEDFRKDLSSAQVGAPPGGTQFIEIAYTDTDPERARQVVDAAGDVLLERLPDISPALDGVNAIVWERAVVPDEPVTEPSPLRAAFVGLLCGVMLGVGLAFFLELFGTRRAEG